MNLTDQDEKIRPNPFKINSNSKYGFLFFEKDPQTPIRQWKGWSSIGGQEATRFKNIAELPIDIIWLSNLEKNEQWKLGKFKKIKDSSFFGSDILTIMAENLINTEKTEDYCASYAEVFSLVIDQMSCIFSELNIPLNFQDGNGYDFLRKAISKEYGELDYSFEKIISATYTETIKVQIPPNETRKMKVLTLSKMRSSYFRELIKEALYPDGNWMPIGKDKLPENNDKKRNFIEKNNKYPMLINIADINIRKGNNWSKNNEMYLFLGDRLDNISKSPIWITREEYEIIKDKVSFEIKAILINDNYSKISNPIISKFLSEEIVFDNSITKQLLTSVLYYCFSAKTRDGGNRRRFKITPRELWVKNRDNIEMFQVANALQQDGFTVCEYGNGEISILYDENLNVNNLIKLAEKHNLIVPTKLLKYGSLVKNIDFKDLRIGDKEKNIIFNQWLQNDWGKQNAILTLPISLIIDRISYFLNGDENLNKSQRIKDNLQILTAYLKSIPDSDFKNRFKDLYTIQITKNIEKLKSLS